MKGHEERLGGARRSAPSGSRATLGLAALVVGAALALAACGGGSGKGPGVAAVPSTTTHTDASSKGQGATGSGATASASGGSSGTAPSSPDALEAEELRFSECMRSHGDTNFPDPSSTGGFEIPVSGPHTAQDPRVEAALRACKKYEPNVGGPGSGPPPSAQTVAHWLKVTQCMRRHGIFDFPEPATKVPSNPGHPQVISDRDGVILLFPPSLDMQSPAFLRAAAACGFQLTNH